jgi:hypothetical protein
LRINQQDCPGCFEGFCTNSYNLKSTLKIRNMKNFMKTQQNPHSSAMARFLRGGLAAPSDFADF